MSSIASVSGLSSGVQWQGLIDQMMTVQQTQILDPITADSTLQGTKRGAWTELNGLLTTLSDAARNLGLTGGFNAVTASAPASPTTGRTLVTATGGILATPGSYSVQVQSLAQAEKIGGASVADATAALGLAGDFTINGKTISIAAGDSLRAVRDKISALNTGATATGVTASILSTGTGANRLVLTSDKPGASGITLGGDTSGVARDLGFMSSQTKQISSATAVIATALGVTMPPPSTIKVNGRTIQVDLTVDSLSSIAAKIQVAGASAEVVQETNGGVPTYRLSIGGSVLATADAGSADTLTTLGIDVGDRRAVTQTVATAAFTSGGVAATGSSLLTSLSNGAGSLGITAGDAINIRGLRADGSVVSNGITVGAGDTIDTLLAKINSAADGFGAGATTARAAIGPDGKIRLMDATGGDSRTTFALDLVHPGGVTSDIGGTSIETVGRQREMVAGSDALVKLDGTTLTRSSNTISDAIPGVTLQLQQAEPGTTVTLSVTQDVDAQVKRVQDFVTAYNAVQTFNTNQQVDGQPLKSDTTLRRVLSQLTGALRTDVPAAGSFSKLALTGVTLDRTGNLTVNTATLKGVLASDQSAVATLFGSDGVSGALRSSVDLLTRFGDGTITNQLSNIDKRVASDTTKAKDAQARLDFRRTQLEQQFASMETLLAKLNSQSSFLTQQFNSLSKSN